MDHSSVSMLPCHRHSRCNQVNKKALFRWQNAVPEGQNSSMCRHCTLSSLHVATVRRPGCHVCACLLCSRAATAPLPGMSGPGSWPCPDMAASGMFTPPTALAAGPARAGPPQELCRALCVQHQHLGQLAGAAAAAREDAFARPGDVPLQHRLAAGSVVPCGCRE